jgi:hypothetical protein
MASKTMSDPRDLFLHELGDVLYAEQTLVKALPKLKDEASDQELARGFSDHLEETRQHVENLKLAFEELGEQPKAEKCPGTFTFDTRTGRLVRFEETLTITGLSGAKDQGIQYDSTTKTVATLSAKPPKGK